MRFNKLDLNLLVALDVLLSLKNVSRAAEKLNVSQSAMSNALARLREHLDDELLVQVGRKMELTQRAYGLQDAVRDVLVRINSTITAKPEFVAEKSERLFRVFVSDYTMVTLIPHLLALCAEQSSNVRFEFLSQTSQPQRMLERGEADLLIVPKIYCSAEHPTEVLVEEDFCCIVWEKNPVAKGKFTLERYQNAGHIVMQPPSSSPSLEGTLMLRLGVERRVEVTTFSFVSALSLVVGTNRIATVHRRLADYGKQFLPIVVLPAPLELPSMVQSMQWHLHSTNDPGLIWLRSMMRQAVTRMDQHSQQR